jgi:hypothetical protein
MASLATVPQAWQAPHCHRPTHLPVRPSDLLIGNVAVLPKRAPPSPWRDRGARLTCAPGTVGRVELEVKEGGELGGQGP